jgi:hypothetical protein
MNIDIKPIGFVKAGRTLAGIGSTICRSLPGWSHELMRDYCNSKE